eukprot:2737514-Pyramimonas_sp.AAC.1
MAIGVPAADIYCSKPSAKLCCFVSGRLGRQDLQSRRTSHPCHTLCLGVLSFVMKFAPSSHAVHAAYNNALQLMVIGPRFSVNYGAFRAPKSRLIWRREEISGILADFEIFFQSDEACIATTMSGWANISCAPGFLRTFRNVRGFLSAAPKGTPEDGKSLQATVA